MKKSQFQSWLLAAVSLTLPVCSFAKSAEVTTQWSYQTVDGKQIHSQKKLVELSDSADSSDDKMSKTLLLLNLANGLKSSLEEYANACTAGTQVGSGYREEMHPLCGGTGPSTSPIPHIQHPCFPMPPRPRPRVNDCDAARRVVSTHLQSTIATLNAQITKNQWTRSDRAVVEALDYGRKLAANMEKAPEPNSYYPKYPRYPGSPTPLRSLSMAPSMMAAAPGGLNVTSGGAQGYDQFKKIVDAGQVPSSEVLAVDGFLKEFDLSLSEGHCDQLLCVDPAVTLDRANKKMYVQISMGSNVTPASFKRKPLNLSVVLDVSGSMGGTDGTEKSRLEWAKDALNRIVEELTSDDYLSIVIFDQASQVIRQPAPLTNRAELKALIDRIQLGGSTNLEAGMKDGFRLVESKLEALQGYENRVITISDAGTNTGIQDEASFVRLVNSYANEGIGMTVLGVGDDFRGGLVEGFAMTKGGNFQHAQTGLAMLKFFENFDYLVTPVAYQFKASLAVAGINAKFSKAYGVPAKEGQAIDELINIQTLFFSTGGGAIVLEYSLE